MRKSILIFCIAFSCLATGVAQQVPQPPSIQTPDVANINKFIDFPIDKGTGVPAISIPLYTIEEPDFSLPIALGYHAGGIKVEEQSGDIGLGWSMNVAGSISRSVRDKPDEGASGYYTDFGSLVTQWHLCSVLNYDPGPINPEEYESLTFDKEPDMFSFSVGEYSGRFVFDPSRTIHLIPDQDLVIKPNDNSFNTWTIITPDGTQYIFGTYEHISGHGLISTQDDTKSAWKVTQIITPNGHTINLQYQPSGYQDETIEPYQQGIGTLGDYNSSLTGRVYYTNFSGLQLTKITSDLCEMDFNYSTTRRADVKDGYNVYALNNVQIKNTLSGAVIKQFNLYQSYFISTSVPTLNYGWPILGYQSERLRLDSIAELDGSNNRLPAYIFSYNKNNPVANLPYRVSTGRDHWGYYNGVTYNQVLVSNPPSSYNAILSPYQSVLAYREPDDNFRKAYILDEIKFPTGATTDYTYESIVEPGVNSIIGGLRVNQIVTTPGNSQQPVVKQYTYQNPTLTGGFPVYFQSIYNAEDGCNGPDYNTQLPCHNYIYMLSNDPVNTSGSDLSGNFVVHGEVIETQPGNGSHEYYYDVDHIDDESNYDEIGTYPYIQRYPLLYSGKLISEIVKDASGNPLTEADYSYTAYNRTGITAAQEWRTYSKLCDPFLMAYDQLSGGIYLSQKSEIAYQPQTGGSITKTTTYTYGGIPSITSIINNNTPNLHMFPTAVATTLSDGSQAVKRYKYPLDYQAAIGTPGPSSTWDAASLGIQTLISQHKISLPVEELTDRVRGGVENVVEGRLNYYATAAGSTGNTLVSLNQASSLNILNPVSYASTFWSTVSLSGSAYQFSNNTNYQPLVNFPRYDGQNNLLDYVGRDGIHKSYIWGYKSNYPIAVTTNAASFNTFYTSFEEATGTGIVAGGKTGTQSSTAGLQQTLPGLTNGSYLLTWWSYSGSVWSLQSSTVNVTGGTYTISLTGQVDEVRFCPVGAQMTTYTYSPLKGITTANDPNNRINTYEYDGFSRLVRIRDQDNNILKQYNYQYQYNPYGTANWQATGQTRCKPCQANSAYITSTGQTQMKDVNPSSPTYNQLTWVDQGMSSACTLQMSLVDWQNTSTPPVCQTDVNGINTGDQLHEQIDQNPCSSTYTTKQWADIGTNTTACPLPTIYAKLQYGNEEVFDDGSVYADINVFFYSDAACTQPYYINSLNVTYKRVDPCGTGTTTTVVNCYGSNTQTLDPSDYLSYPNGSQTCTVTYSLLPGTGYIVVN